MASQLMSSSYGRPHVLLAWELGANRGHVMPLAEIARELMARGARITFAVQRLDALRTIRPLHETIRIVQAPVWPGLLTTAGFRPRHPAVTFGDIVADLGLRDSAVVEFLLRAWDGLLTTLAPDVIVADFAPMVQLAARGRVPVVAVGNGFSLPPSHTPTFPRLRNATPLYEEARLVEAVNLALARTGRGTIARLPEILTAEVCLPRVFPIFDPYHAHRREKTLPPIFPEALSSSAGDGEEIFVYFSDIVDRPQRLFDAIAAIGARARLYVPNLPEPAARELAAAGVAVERRPQTIADIARRSRLVVSHGGLGFVSMTLAAGLPQLVLAPDLEKRLTGAAVVRLGVGQMLAWRDVTSEKIVEAINAIDADAKFRDSARRVGNALLPLLRYDSAEHVAETVLSLAAKASVS